MWEIEKIISKGDYNYCIVRDHPNRTKNDYVLEHRVVLENHLGRVLKEDEVVHHKNGNKKDNRAINLEVLTNKEHSILHGEERAAKYVLLECPMCGKIFEKPHNQTHLCKKTNDATNCSRSCGCKYGRLKQLNKELPNIENNVIKIYEK